MCALRYAAAMLLLPMFLACTGATGPDVPDTGDDSGTLTAVDYLSPGAYAVGRRTLVLADDARPLTVELWFPATAAGDGQPIEELVVDPGDRATYSKLLAAAPTDCPTRSSAALPDATVAVDGPLPLVVYSHCHTCTRFSGLSVAELLASHGYAVAAPDHDGNTLFDELAGDALGVDGDTLDLRVADLGRVLDAGLAGALDVDVDPARVAVVGHSFGSVTAGALLAERRGTASAPAAGAFMGAPVDTGVLGDTDAAEIVEPTLFLVLAEDHSVGTLGNTLMAGNFDEVAGPAWLVELADAGHWSVSDLCGIVDDFMPGCGEDTRQEGGESFTYLPAADGRLLAGAVTTAFLDSVFSPESAADAWLRAPPDARLSVRWR